MSERPNIFEPRFDSEETEPGFVHRRARLGRQAAAEGLGVSLYELPPAQASFPYHWQAANEEMLIVLRGRPSLRTPAGWRELAEGELVSFARGEGGAHQVANRSSETVRFLVLSEMNAPEVSGYPDSAKILASTRAPGGAGAGEMRCFRLEDEVDYYEGEAGPGEKADQG